MLLRFLLIFQLFAMHLVLQLNAYTLCAKMRKGPNMYLRVEIHLFTVTSERDWSQVVSDSAHCYLCEVVKIREIKQM